MIRSGLRFTLAVLAYIGVATWLFLLAAVRGLPREEAARVAAVVAIATGGEILGSLILGLYAYRRGGIPAFVPPGHGLVCLAGLRLSETVSYARTGARSRSRGRGVGRTDRRPRRGGALAMVALLELNGTGMGTWEWARRWPGLHVAMGNPPSGVAAGYCVFDALALRLDLTRRSSIGMAVWRSTSTRATA